MRKFLIDKRKLFKFLAGELKHHHLEGRIVFLCLSYKHSKMPGSLKVTSKYFLQMDFLSECNWNSWFLKNKFLILSCYFFFLRMIRSCDKLRRDSTVLYLKLGPDFEKQIMKNQNARAKKNSIIRLLLQYKVTSKTFFYHTTMKNLK